MHGNNVSGLYQIALYFRGANTHSTEFRDSMIPNFRGAFENTFNENTALRGVELSMSTTREVVLFNIMDPLTQKIRM